jgi:predicted nucleic acid-binding protein
LSERVFIDTNVLAYCDDPRDRAKQRRALQVLADLTESARAVISTQVLQEYFVTATRKLGVAPDVARGRVETFSMLEVVVVRPELVLGAIDLHRRSRISFWDALIVRCASAAGCARLYSEDLGHGQVIDGVRVENPFLLGGDRAEDRPGRARRRQRPGR